MKYRVRLSNGRVIGPLEIKDFVQLYNENKITGNEDAQVYPTGDWKPLSYFTEINLEKTINEDKTFMKNLDLANKIKGIHLKNGILTDTQPTKYAKTKFTIIVMMKASLFAI